MTIMWIMYAMGMVALNMESTSGRNAWFACGLVLAVFLSVATVSAPGAGAPGLLAVIGLAILVGVAGRSGVALVGGLGLVLTLVVLLIPAFFVVVSELEERGAEFCVFGLGGACGCGKLPVGDEWSVAGRQAANDVVGELGVRVAAPGVFDVLKYRVEVDEVVARRPRPHPARALLVRRRSIYSERAEMARRTRSLADRLT